MKITCFYAAVSRVEKILRVQYYYISRDDQADALHDSIQLVGELPNGSRN